MPNLFERLPELTIGVSGFDPRVDGNPLRGVGWPEIATALGSCSTEQSDILRMMYLNDEKAGRNVLHRLGEVVRVYNPRLPPALTVALVLATLRAYAGMRPCPECGGEGRVHVPRSFQIDCDSGEMTEQREHFEDCWMCDADGFEHVSHSSVQLAMRVSIEVWESLCADAFAEAYGALRTWHDSGKRLLNAKAG